MLYRPSTQTSIPIPIPSPVAKRRIAIAPRCNLRSSRPICIVIAVSWCLRRSGRAPRASHPIPPAVHHQDRWALQKWRWRARGGRDRSPVADLDRRHRPQMVRRTAATVTRPRTCPRTARARPPAPAYQTVHQVVVMKRQQHHHHRAERPMSTRAHKLNSLTIQLPPCGRGFLGPCTAIIEAGPTGAILRCLTCNCIAPLTTQHTKGGQS